MIHLDPTNLYNLGFLYTYTNVGQNTSKLLVLLLVSFWDIHKLRRQEFEEFPPPPPIC